MRSPLLQIIGSPANWQTRIQDWSVHMNLNVQPNTSARFIPESIWVDVIHPEVLRQCDAIDGLADGIINDPRFCESVLKLCQLSAADKILASDQRH